jgi:hypothetical protein
VPSTLQWLMNGGALAAHSLPAAGVIMAWPEGSVLTYFRRLPSTPTWRKKATAAPTAGGRTTRSSVPL